MKYVHEAVLIPPSDSNHDHTACMLALSEFPDDVIAHN
jgi:hypothetical protein